MPKRIPEMSNNVDLARFAPRVTIPKAGLVGWGLKPPPPKARPPPLPSREIINYVALENDAGFTVRGNSMSRCRPTHHGRSTGGGAWSLGRRLFGSNSTTVR